MLFSKNKSSNSDFDDYDDEPYSMGLPWNTAKGNVDIEPYTNEIDASSTTTQEEHTFVLTEEAAMPLAEEKAPAKVIQIQDLAATPPSPEKIVVQEEIIEFQQEAIIPQAKAHIVPANKMPAIQMPADLSLSASEDIIRRFSTNIRSAIGVGTVVEGSFCFDAPVCIDGTLNGEIESSSVLFVGAQAEVNAKIKVGGLIVLGKVQGEIEAEELIEIREGGEIEADVTTKRIIIQDGGLFKGKCSQHS